MDRSPRGNQIAAAPFGCACLVRRLTRNARRLSSVCLLPVAIFGSAADAHDHTVSRDACRGGDFLPRNGNFKQLMPESHATKESPGRHAMPAQAGKPALVAQRASELVWAGRHARAWSAHCHVNAAAASTSSVEARGSV